MEHSLHGTTSAAGTGGILRQCTKEGKPLLQQEAQCPKGGLED